MSWNTRDGSMPDGNSASLERHLDDLDEGCARMEFLERECPEADLRIEIADSVFEDDPHDFIPWCCDGNRGEALLMLAYAALRPDCKPKDFDTNLRIRLEARAQQVIDNWIDSRLPDVRKQWIEEALRDDYGN